MEKVADVGSLLLLPAYPPSSVRQHLPFQQWESCLDIWILSVEHRLRLSDKQFSHLKFSQSASGVSFLTTYLTQYEQRSDSIQSGSSEAKLHHQCYFLLKRLLLQTKAPYDIPVQRLTELLGGGCLAFQAISDWKSTLSQAWKRSAAQITSVIEYLKTGIIKAHGVDSDTLARRFTHLSSLVKCLPEAAVIAVAGVDFSEAITTAYTSYKIEVQKLVTECLYLCLRSFMMASNKHTSLLLDTLFNLKTETDHIEKTQHDTPTLFSNLLCSTPFIRHLRSDSAVMASKRGQGIVDTLSSYREHKLQLHPPPARPSDKRKGKSKANAQDEMHMHKASKVSQVHDLFPDLSSAYVMNLLDHFSDDVESVIAALLEPSSLPPALQDQMAPEDQHMPTIETAPDLAPRSTPPLLPQRKNVFDGDDFDKLQISSDKLHRGRREVKDQPLSLNQQARSKAAIMAALAAFDADDDERDDTYDVGDVGGAVDNTVDSDERRPERGADQTEKILFQAWQVNPELFGRDSKTRLSTARRQLNEEVGMTNEQLEGWSIMMSKDPKMAERLQRKYAIQNSFTGTQRVIESTRWQAHDSASDSQDESRSSPSDGRRVGQAGIRGARIWNRGGGRGGGSTAGPTESDATQQARKRKEQGRGRGGAQHRRDGRAKKMGRGMAGPMA